MHTSNPIKRRFGHQSKLPLFLYPLSFAPPLTPPWVSVRDFFVHPWTLYFIGLIGLLPSCAALPATQYIQGFYWIPGITNLSLSAEERIQVGIDAATYQSAVIVGVTLGYWVWLSCFVLASYKLRDGIQLAYIRAILAQDAAYFDKHGSGEIAARGAKDMDIISKGYGEHLGWVMWFGGYLVGSVVVSATSLPKLFGGLFALVLTMVAVMIFLGRLVEPHQRGARKADEHAYTFLEQCFSGTRIVRTFGMRPHLIARFGSEILGQAEQSGVKQVAIQTSESGLIMAIFILITSVMIFYGGRLIRDGANLGQVVACSYNMGNLLFQGYGRIPNLTGFRQAQYSLREIRRHIERQPLLDVRDETGHIIEPANLPTKGDALIEFEGVSFAYPSRPSMKALDGISFVAKAGELTALVGPSGAGKSSIGALLLREYDPMTANLANPEDEDGRACQNGLTSKLRGGQDLDREEKSIRKTIAPSESSQTIGTGVIRFAGNDLRCCNLKSLRSHISVVHQDPQLLSGTIFQNVIAGLANGADHARDQEKSGTVESLRDRCIEALRSAEAWDFVEALPEGMDTVVSGGRTTMLSGGQQQRIALARALFRRPVLLILDEATSALSSDIEMKIRHNLERIQRQSDLTIISIAHRLQFAQTAHNVLVMDKGIIVDEGTFETLTQGPRHHSVFIDLLDACQSDGPSVHDETLEIFAEETNGAQLEQNNIPQEDRNVSGASGKDASQLEPGVKKRVLEKIGNRKWAILFALVLAIVLAGCTQGGRVHVQGRAQGKVSGNTNDATSTDTYALIFAVAAVPIGLVAWGLDGLAGISARRLQRMLASDSANNILQQEISYFDTQGSSAGTLTASLSKHTGRVADVYTITLSKLVFQFGIMVTALILGITLSWKFAVFALALMLPVIALGFVQIWADVHLKAAHDPSQALMSASLNEAVDAIRIIAATGQESVVAERLERMMTEGKCERKWLMVKQPIQAVGIAMAFVGGAVYWRRGAWLYARGEISVAALFACLEAGYAVVMTCPPIIHHFNEISQAVQSWSLIRVYLARKPQHIRQAAPVSSGEDYAAALRGNIVFSNVSMGYPTRRGTLALDGLDLRIQAGTVTAFTGPSGGGKSTILALVQGFYDQLEGSIEFGTINSQNIPMEVLQSHLAIVSQSSVLFEGSIRFNLCLGARDPDNVIQAELDYVCKEARILDFIQSLPDGFSTDIGLKGTRLSGGQRQRLCIARALLRNPRILLLDEATSSLDAVNEAEVEKALQNAAQGRTVIVLAHKLQSIKNADTICVIEAGKLVESGNHEQLVQRKSRYYELVKSQL